MASKCPHCGSENVVFRRRAQVFICGDCDEEWRPNADQALRPLRIFLSYGHDEYAALALRIKSDLECRGHQVWFDQEKLGCRQIWDAEIERAIEESERFLLLMTPHSVRRKDPRVPDMEDGFCLNELAKAIECGKTIVPVLVAHLDQGPPVPIRRIQWLDMRDCVPLETHEERYRKLRFPRLVAALEQEELDFGGTYSRLHALLKPLNFQSHMERHLKAFRGRAWLLRQIDAWMSEKNGAQVFLILAGPGVGKSALATAMAHSRGDVAAVHYCVDGHSDLRDVRKSVLSLAYQLSTHLVEYGRIMENTDLEEEATKDGGTAFHTLLVEPLHRITPPRFPLFVILDGLDEATYGNRNEIAAKLCARWDAMPRWLRLLITSRPTPDVLQSLQYVSPLVVDTERKENLDDICYYVENELREMGYKGEALRQWSDRLVQESEGVFLYVVSLLEWLRTRGVIPPAEVAVLPRGMYGFYARCFEKLFRERGISEYDQSYRPLLAAMITAQAALPLGFLALATGQSEHHVRHLISQLGALFPIHCAQGSGDTVSPFHKSLVDWLTQVDENTGLFVAGQFSVNPGEASRPLAEACIRAYDGEGTPAGRNYARQYGPIHLCEAGMCEELAHVLARGDDYLQERALFYLREELPRRLEVDPSGAEKMIRAIIRERSNATNRMILELVSHWADHSMIATLNQLAPILSETEEGLDISDYMRMRLARVTGRPAEVVEKGRRLLERRPSLPDVDLTLHFYLGEGLRELGNHEEAYARFLQAQELGNRDQNVREWLRLGCALADMDYVYGRLNRAMARAEEGLAMAEERNLQIAIIRFVRTKGHVLAHQGKRRPAMDHYFRCLRIAEAACAPHHIVEALNSLAEAGYRFDPGQAIAWLRKARTIARECDSQLEMGKGHYVEGQVHLVSGRPQQALDSLNEAEQILTRVSYGSGLARTAFLKSRAYGCLGEHQRAHETATQALDYYRRERIYPSLWLVALVQVHRTARRAPSTPAVDPFSEFSAIPHLEEYPNLARLAAALRRRSAK